MAKPHNCQCHSGFTCGACLARAPAYHFTPTRETFAEYCARPHPEKETAMAWDRYEFTIGKHFLSALINGDVTALENDEFQKLKTFEHKAALLLEKHDAISSHWTVDVADCTHFSKCEVTGLYADVADVALEFQFKE